MSPKGKGYPPKQGKGKKGESEVDMDTKKSSKKPMKKSGRKR